MHRLGASFLAAPFRVSCACVSCASIGIEAIGFDAIIFKVLLDRHFKLAYNEPNNNPFLDPGMQGLLW